MLSLLPVDMGFDPRTEKTPVTLPPEPTTVRYLDADNVERTAIGSCGELAQILAEAGYVVLIRPGNQVPIRELTVDRACGYFADQREEGLRVLRDVVAGRRAPFLGITWRDQLPRPDRAHRPPRALPPCHRDHDQGESRVGEEVHRSTCRAAQA
jgi:hypothetical protein